MADKDDVRIEIARPVHREGLLNIIENVFIKGEPVEQAMNVTWTQAKNDWVKVIDSCLKHPHSHLALNAKNEVVGFRLSRIINVATHPDTSIYDWLSADLKDIVDQLTHSWPRVLEKSVDSMQFIALCVHPDYGGRGLALEMCIENLALAKRLGCDSCTVVASNWMSQRVFEKAGFILVESMLFTDFRNKTGSQLLQVKDPKQTSLKFYAMDL